MWSAFQAQYGPVALPGNAFRADFDARLAQDLGHAQTPRERAVGLLDQWYKTPHLTAADRRCFLMSNRTTTSSRRDSAHAGGSGGVIDRPWSVIGGVGRASSAQRNLARADAYSTERQVYARQADRPDG